MNQPALNDTTSTEPLVDSEQGRQTPLVRVSLLGAFQMVWQVPPATNEALWNSRTSARILLKLLLCTPGRQAPKSVLAGILWPESEEEKARESLRQASTVLRKMMRSADGVELLEQRHGGEILKLADQARLWVDADAFEALLAQASRATTPDEAFRCWQEAYALLRGEMLVEDQASEWVRHGWVKRRKQSVWLARCRLIRHLADAYVQRGQGLLAEEVLEQHLVRFPTDHDALYRLLVLLEQQGCYEQASILYEQARRSLEAVGKQLTRQVKACYERMQGAVSSHVFLPLSQLDIAIPPSPRGTSNDAAPSPVVAPVLSHGQLESSETMLMSITNQIFSLLTSDGMSTHSLDTLDVLQVLVAGKGKPDVSLLSRRQLLELGIAALISQLAQLDSKHVSALEREVLSQVLGESIAASWKLLLSVENAMVVAIGRAQLALIHQAHALISPPALPYFYAGAHSFIGIGLHFQERDEEALQAYHHGYIASLATGDPWYVAQSLICQADSYHALGEYSKAIQAVEEALRIIARSTDEGDKMQRAKAHLLSCWADSAMMLHDERITQEKLEMAATLLEPHVCDEEFDRSAWLLIVGKHALHVGNNGMAKDCFEEALASLPEPWVLRRVMTATGLAMAYARLGERDVSMTYAQDLVPLIQVTNTPLTNRWFTHYLHQDLLDKFPTDGTVRAFVADTSRQLSQQANKLRAGR